MILYKVPCGESNFWPQFPVTLKTCVVEINVFNAYKILECVTINRKDLSYSVRAPENLSTYHIFRNSIVQSLSNMKNKSNDFLSCEKHVTQSGHFLHTPPIKVRNNFNIASYWY